MKRIILFFFIFLILPVPASRVFANEIPEFTSCVNPQGQIKASYESGTHGVAGRPGLFEGKDVVYSISGNAVTQCFCAIDGIGVQTNFWKIPALTEPEIEALKLQGWIYIPNGALWGLENTPYMAKNSDFSCKGTGSGANTGSSDSGNSSSNSVVNSNQGSLSGGIGRVLGLASTGNSIFLLGTALTSGLSLLLGLIFKKRVYEACKSHA